MPKFRDLQTCGTRCAECRTAAKPLKPKITKIPKVFGVCPPRLLLIADDHAIVRFGISTLINSTGDMEVTAMASNGEEAVETARRLAPDIVIMDLMMPKKDAAAALAQTDSDP